MAVTASLLSGIKVLDLSRVLAGPWAGQMLADLGANVIKIERPIMGDDTRKWGPPFAPAIDDTSPDSAYFCCANRGKRSVCIDITSVDGQQQLHKLAAQADIVLENFKVGQAAKYRLDYPNLSAINPRIIYCSISGFGQTGPYASRPGYDFLVQAMGGLMSVTGEKGGEPLKVGVALTDIMTGMYATVGILAALHERLRSGLGQHIDLSLLDVTAACLANQATNYLIGGRIPQPLGNAHPNIVPYQSFATGDGHCVITVGNDRQFSRLCMALGKPALSEDRRFHTNQQRVVNRDILIPQLEKIIAKFKTADILALLQEYDVPVAPINNMQQVFDDPQIKAREMAVEITRKAETLTLVGNPLKFSRTPIQYGNAPPALGEHSQEILREGFD